MTRRVAVLRPEPGNAATMARLAAAGLEAVSIPLFAIQPLDWAVPDIARFDALVLTSANAVRHAGGQLTALRHLPVYAVGGATAEAALAAGLNVVTVGLGGARDLRLPPRTLHLCGRDRAAQVGSCAIPVYASTAVSSPDTRPLEGAIAMLHSPRAARRLRELVMPASLSIAAISPAAALAAGDGWRSMVVAAAPNDAALIAALRAGAD